MPISPTECICSYNTHRPEGEGTRTDVSRNPKCPVHNPQELIKLDAVKALLLNDIARRAMTYRRLIQQVQESCKESFETNLGRSIHFDAALKADVEWKQMEASIDVLYDILESREELNRLRKIAITPVPSQNRHDMIRRWFKEGEEI